MSLISKATFLSLCPIATSQKTTFKDLPWTISAFHLLRESEFTYQFPSLPH